MREAPTKAAMARFRAEVEELEDDEDESILSGLCRLIENGASREPLMISVVFVLLYEMAVHW